MYDDLYFRYLTAVITVDHGVVKSITWDDGCYACNSSECSENTIVVRDGKPSLINSSDPVYGKYQGKNCYVSYDICQDDPSKCDLAVFLTWSGTDRRGNVLQSHNLRMSRFQTESMESILDDLLA
jgi:hypothetical protein